MTIKKSKSSSKKNAAVAEYKSFADDILDYAGRHHFHSVITNMLYAVYSEKSEDPYNFMINYLIEKKGNKQESYANHDHLLKEIQQKDEEIKKLYNRIAYLENFIDMQKSQASQLIGNTSFQNNVSLATTLTNMSGLSVSEIEKFIENPSFLKGFESQLNLPDQNAITSEEIGDSNIDDGVLVPTNKSSVEQENINDLILTFNYSRLTKSEPYEAPQQEPFVENNSSLENSDELVLEVNLSESEIIDNPVEVEVPKKIFTPVNNFDDFEPDYEPDDDE